MVVPCLFFMVHGPVNCATLPTKGNLAWVHLLCGCGRGVTILGWNASGSCQEPHRFPTSVAVVWLVPPVKCDELT